MEDQQNGYIYETASQVELRRADHRGQALIIRRRPAPRGRPGDGPSGAGGSPRDPEPGPLERRTAAAAD